MVEFKDVMEIFNAINKHHGIYPTNPYKTDETIADDYFSDGISTPSNIMPMFRLEFTERDIPQLIAVSYKIDYLNQDIDSSDKKNNSVNEPINFNEFVIYKMNDEFRIDDEVLHHHYPNHLTLNKKDMINCLYAQAIALTSGLSFDATKNILDNDNEVSRTLNANLDNPVVSLKQLSMLSLKQFMFDNSRLNSDHEVMLTLVAHYHDLKSNNMQLDSEHESDDINENIYYEQSNKSYQQYPKLTKILTVKPANIEIFIQPKHTSNHYQMQIKHPELFKDDTDGQYLSNISMIVTHNFPDKNQKQLTIDNDYYVTVANVLKQEYDMSWKTIENMVENNIDNIKLPADKKEKIKHGQ